MPDQKRAFISYVHGEGDLAQSLRKSLENRSIDVWMDDNIPPGEDWQQWIDGAIACCDVFLVFLHPGAHIHKFSQQVLRECQTALRLEKRIVPLCVVKISYQDLDAYGLSHLQAMQLRLPKEPNLIGKLRNSRWFVSGDDWLLPSDLDALAKTIRDA